MASSSPLFEKFLDELCDSTKPAVGYWNFAYEDNSYTVTTPTDRRGYADYARVFCKDAAFIAGEAPYVTLIVSEKSALAYTKDPIASIKSHSTLTIEDLPKFLGVGFCNYDYGSDRGIKAVLDKFIQWRIANGI